MHCPNCGVEVPEDVQFCPNCGAKLEVMKGGKANVSVRTSSSTSSIVYVIASLVAGALTIFSVIILVGFISLSSRLNSLLNTVLVSLNAFGADTYDPTVNQIIQYAKNAISGIGRTATLMSILIFLTLFLLALVAFLIVSINRKVDRISNEITKCINGGALC